MRESEREREREREKEREREREREVVGVGERSFEGEKYIETFIRLPSASLQKLGSLTHRMYVLLCFPMPVNSTACQRL